MQLIFMVAREVCTPTRNGDRAMRKKLSRENGLTIVEMMAATVILILVGMMLGTGLQMALQTYQKIVAQSEVELLLSSAVDALADELRFAQNVSAGGVSGVNFTYDSDFYGKPTRLELTGGRILANGEQMLSTGAYGSGGLYRSYSICAVDGQPIITPHVPSPESASNEITFTIHLKVVADGTDISAKTPDEGVTIRCLNLWNPPS